MVWELSGVIRKDVFEKMISEQSPEVGETGCEGGPLGKSEQSSEVGETGCVGGTLGKVSRKTAQPMQMSWGRSVPEGFDGFQEGLSRGSKKCSSGEGGWCVSVREQSFTVGACPPLASALSIVDL